MNREQCRGCTYFRALGWGGRGKNDGFRVCHYMLYTGKRRQRDGDKCLEYSKKRISVKVRPLSGDATGKSIYSGYKLYPIERYWYGKIP